MNNLNKKQINAIDTMNQGVISERCKESGKRFFVAINKYCRYSDEMEIVSTKRKIISGDVMRSLRTIGLVKYNNSVWQITSDGVIEAGKISYWRVPNSQWSGPGYYYYFHWRASTPGSMFRSWEFHGKNYKPGDFTFCSQVFSTSQKPIYMSKQSFYEIGKLWNDAELILDHEAKDYDCNGDESGYDEISVVLYRGMLYVKHLIQNPMGQGYVHGWGEVYYRPKYKIIKGLMEAEDPKSYYYSNVHYGVQADDSLSSPEFM